MKPLPSAEIDARIKSALLGVRHAHLTIEQATERIAALLAEARNARPAAPVRDATRVTPPAECDCDGDDETGHDYLCPALGTRPTPPADRSET